MRIIDKLEVLHESGYIFLDMKPNNILVGDTKDTELNKVRLIDFGISKPYQDKDGNHVKLERV